MPILQERTQPTLRCPKKLRDAIASYPRFFDRGGTRALPSPATGSGNARAPTSYARRHNPKAARQARRNQNKKTPDGCLCFVFQSQKRYTSESCVNRQITDKYKFFCISGCFFIFHLYCYAVFLSISPVPKKITTEDFHF